MLYKKVILTLYSLLISVFCISQTFDELKDSMIKLARKGDNINAIIVGEKAKVIAKINLQNNDFNYLLNCSYLSSLYEASSDYKKAIENIFETLPIAESLFGKDNLNYAGQISRLGNLYETANDSANAIPLFRQVREIRSKALENDSSLMVLYLISKADSLIIKDSLKLAEYWMMQSINYLVENKFNNNHPCYESVYKKLGDIYIKMNRINDAIELYQEELKIIKNSIGINNFDYLVANDRLVESYIKASRNSEANSALQTNIIILKNVLTIEHPDFTAFLDRSGSQYFQIGDYKKSEIYFREALTIRKKLLGTQHPDYEVSLIHMGGFYSEMGEYKKAESYYLEANTVIKKVLGTMNTVYAESLNYLGVLYDNLNDYKKAEPYLLEGLAIRKKLLKTKDLNYVASLDNLGAHYSFSTLEYIKAEPYFLEALAVTKKIFGAKQPSFSYFNILNNLGGLYSSIGEYKKSEAYYKEALAMCKNVLGTKHSKYAIILNNLVFLYYRTGDFMKSFEYLSLALDITNKNIKQNFDFLTERGKSSFFRTISSRFDLFHSLFFTSFPEYLSESSTLYNIELLTKNLVVRSSLEVRNAINNNGDTDVINSLAKLSVIKKGLANIYSHPKDKYPNDVNLLEEQADSLDKQLLNQSQEYRHEHEQSQLDWKTVQQKLKQNEVAVEFISFPYLSKHGWTDSVMYSALVLRPGYDQPKYVYLFVEKQLSSILKNDKGVLDQAYINQLYQQRESSNPLYQLIWHPLDSLLQGVTTVYASPTGLLHKIALGAIPVTDSSTVSSKYTLQIVGTTADIINKKEDFIDKKSVQQALLFGGINYDIASSKPVDFISSSTNNIYAFVPADSSRGATGKWNYLSGAFTEATEIARQFNEQKITTHFYSDSTATETLFKNMPVNTSSVIHIATHGYFFPDIVRKKDDGLQLIDDKKQTAFRVSENPLLRSGLIFAGANPSWTNPDYVSTATDDGILTAYEISNMDLSNVKLVVLSACETGLGDIKGSEGVFGLQRSFKLAGVKNIIMSLWKVPDEKTRELMQRFYQFCFSGKSISEAFNSAQNVMRNKYPDSPYYWAGFTLLQ